MVNSNNTQANCTNRLKGHLSLVFQSNDLIAFKTVKLSASTKAHVSGFFPSWGL